LDQASASAPREHSGFYDTGEASLHYAVGGAGSAMILFHELGGGLRSWDGVIGALLAQFRVLRFDQRGHGLSEKIRVPFSMADHANDAMALAAHAGLGGRAWLVGAAAGAAAALEFALRFPDRVAGLVLCSPALSTDAARREFLDARVCRAQEAGMRAIAETSLDRSYPDEDRTDRRFADYRARWLANDPVAYGLANRALIEADFDAVLPSLAHPCLLLAGTRDVLRPPAYVRSLAARIANAQYAELDSGHVMPVQAPHALAEQILRFAHEEVRA
jgi:3-oxoadipate enol-lactonase